MGVPCLRWLPVLLLVVTLAGESTARGEIRETLRELGCLDVTQPPFLADPTGKADATDAIQRAVNAARDRRLACFFPEGIYLISDTISCEQRVEKLDRPRLTDRRTQHYWDLPEDIVMVGSTTGRRPVLKLSADAQGFDDPQQPKVAVHIWAQTRDDAPGREEPQWGKEQPNISFNNVFKGIDVDVRGHAGAIGIRHTGSQGSTLQDATVHAEGAYAGLSNCCGQGGGTYNIEVIGGRYGIVLETISRFPLLTACQFEGQTDAVITYAGRGIQVPTLLVGCRLGPASGCVVEFAKPWTYAGLSLVDCLVQMPPGSVLARASKPENLFLENCYLRGVAEVVPGGARPPDSAAGVLLERYSLTAERAVHLLNGVRSTGEDAQWQPAAQEPSYDELRRRHYTPGPSFEDGDAVNVRTFGARGDGEADDTEAFRQAIAASDKVFVPKGHYRLTQMLELGRNTHLFGLGATQTSIGGSGGAARGPGFAAWQGAVGVMTVDAADAAPGLSFLSVRGPIHWRSGQSLSMLAYGFPKLSGHAGGKFYGTMAMGRPLSLEGIRQPTAFYALNVERVTTNPQSEIRDCSHIRLYYFKVEAGTISRENAGDGNTPCRISDSQDVKIYCMYGAVRKLGGRPMLEVVNSAPIQVSQLKAFEPGEFPHVTEVHGDARSEVPSSDIIALFVRDAP